MAREKFQRSSDESKQRLLRLFLIGSIKKALGVSFNNEGRQFIDIIPPIIDSESKGM